MGGHDEVLVVDNDSSDKTPAIVEEFAHARLIQSTRNVGFGRACNLGVAHSTAPYLVFLNPDCYPTPGAITALVERLRADVSIGAVLPRLHESMARVRETAGAFPSPATELAQGLGLWRLTKKLRVRPGVAIDIDWGFAACLAIRRSTFDEIGGFDESIFLYGEDRDLCKRIRQTGRRIVLDPRIAVNHVGNVSGGQAFSPLERTRLILWSDYRFLRKYHSRAYAELTLAIRSLLTPIRAALAPNGAELRFMGQVLRERRRSQRHRRRGRARAR